MIRAARSRGFTLVEILLTLAIFSSILLVLLSAFTGAERTREILSGRSRAFRQVRVVLDRVGTDLTGAFAAQGVEETWLSCKEDRFSGKPASTLTFTAFVLPDPSSTRPATGLVKLKYFPKVGASGDAIDLYREESSLPLIENGIPNRETRLAERIQGFRLELFDGASWVKEWPPSGAVRTSLPRKAAIILTDAEGREYRRTVSLPLAGQEATVLNSGKRQK